MFEAKDGHEGLKVALEQKPDILLLDFLMPKMDGMTMLKHLRRHKWGREASVIILTNLSKEEHELLAAKHKVYDFLVKSNNSLDEIEQRTELIMSLRTQVI